METTMYEDGYNQYSREGLTQIKRRLTLDLTSRPSKRQRQGGGMAGNFNPLLTSPDLNQLKLASPELERLIMQQSGAVVLSGSGGGGGGGGVTGGGVTTSANTNTTTVTTSTSSSQFFFPKTATVEEEEFARGFEDTLEQLHHQEALAAAVTSGGSGLQYTTLEVPTSLPAPTNSMGLLSQGHIKEEPQTVPSVGASPPVSPINMECQERIKLERKRLRNRIAASKCRRRKLERIGRLEDKVRMLKGENVELQNVVNRLRDQVCSLKQEVMEHVNSGCQIPFVTTHQQ
ncbi:transcription factor Jun-like [Eriocheir sinensis]|uniref:transcription factor Jun-like n=1 Tax=Eriocheir sinensis TaxID=95602 RepID=UPI0021C6447D|nr:transcription factor Jun-like [Eriocheir sinensis]XP_050702641.1 transcription factor Jun-like [Eriocheir sinensis]XP_050702642.1 transcription factor Jun-like [Eriocheir sinensis]